MQKIYLPVRLPTIKRKKLGAVCAVAITVAGWVSGAPWLGRIRRTSRRFSAAVSVGYSPDQHTVDVGHGACKLMDQGLVGDAIDRYIADSVSSSEGSNQFFQAALLRQYAIGHLCPRHQVDYGSNI
jgi:hypothetical protein